MKNLIIILLSAIFPCFSVSACNTIRTTELYSAVQLCIYVRIDCILSSMSDNIEMAWYSGTAKLIKFFSIFISLRHAHTFTYKYVISGEVFARTFCHKPILQYRDIQATISPLVSPETGSVKCKCMWSESCAVH